MVILPYEILTAIFEEIDDVRDLRNVRAASHTLCAAATPMAFRALSVIPTGRSAQNLGRLIDLPDIATHVMEVSYHDPGSDRICVVKPRAIDKLAELFSRIHQLPRLQTINLSFYPSHENWLRVNIQTSILGALVTGFSIRTPQNLISLSLHNLRPLYLASLESPPFQTVLHTLRHLKLSICLPERIDDARWEYFWGTLCPHKIFPLTQHALRQLTLHPDIFIGASSGLSLHELHFPHLCTLSLRKLVFGPSVGIQPFILRHAPTLSRLELIECRLPFDRDDPDIEMLILPPLSPSTPPSMALTRNEANLKFVHWSHIWDSFAAELTALIALHVDERSFARGRYVVPESIDYDYWECAIESRNTADTEALRCFHMTVASRRRRAGYAEGEAASVASLGKW